MVFYLFILRCPNCFLRIPICAASSLWRSCSLFSAADRLLILLAAFSLYSFNESFSSFRRLLLWSLSLHNLSLACIWCCILFNNDFNAGSVIISLSCWVLSSGRRSNNIKFKISWSSLIYSFYLSLYVRITLFMMHAFMKCLKHPKLLSDFSSFISWAYSL